MNDTTLGDPIRGFSSLIRPHFSAGLLLQDDDLTQGVTYTRALSRLMFRTLFGCGVLCGLKVSPPEADKCGGLSIGVAKGVALDCIGDPVEVPTAQNVPLTCATEVGNEIWVALRKFDKCCAPRSAVCSPDEEEPVPVCTRERDGFEIRLFSERPCSCGCARLAPPAAPPEEGGEDLLILGRTTGTKKTAAAKKVAAKTAGDGTAEKRAALEAAPAAPLAAAPAAVAAGTAAHLVEPPPEQLPDPAQADCLCNHRNGAGACYEKHYEGECPCECCDCEWIILALAVRENANAQWTMDHSVRRFVRPVLMRDPIVEDERPAAP